MKEIIERIKREFPDKKVAGIYESEKHYYVTVCAKDDRPAPWNLSIWSFRKDMTNMKDVTTSADPGYKTAVQIYSWLDS